jgi:predicted nucleic acid-binding protein
VTEGHSLARACRRFRSETERTQIQRLLHVSGPVLANRAWIALRWQGTPIPTNDMWLAALVLQHNLALQVRNEHFDRLPQLVLG